MGVLLERARQVFGGAPRELAPPEPYDISCLCGEHITGFRRDHRQFVACSVCGQLHLVLPISSYPRPIAYETPRQLDRVPVEVVRPARPFGLRLRIGLRRMRRAGVRSLWSLVPPARWFSPVRLVIMATLLAVAGTIWMVVFWNRQGSLTSDIVAMRRGWTRDIEAADFAKARTKLDHATAAIKRYGGQSRDAREIQQLASEVAEFADLLDRPLEDVLNALRSMSSADAEQYVRNTLKNPALVLDLVVSPAPDAAPAAYRVDAMIMTGSDRARIDASNLKLFTMLAPTVPRRVVFAARIQSIDRITNTTEWIIRLVPESGVLITSGLCLEKLGWPMDDATQTLLQEQAQWVLEER